MFVQDRGLIGMSDLSSTDACIQSDRMQAVKEKEDGIKEHCLRALRGEIDNMIKISEVARDTVQDGNIHPGIIEYLAHGSNEDSTARSKALAHRYPLAT